MTGVSSELLSAARDELARGRPRAALKKLTQARKTLLLLEDFDGLAKLLELAREIRASAPDSARIADRLIGQTEQDIARHSRGRPASFIEEKTRQEAKERARKARDRYLAAETKKKPPSPRRYRRTTYIGAGVALFFIACFAFLTISSRSQLWPPWQLKRHAVSSGWPTWSPDGRYIAYATGGYASHISVISAAGGRVRRLTNGSGQRPAWSPNGKTILYRSSAGFSVIPARGGKSRLLRSDDGAYGAAWSPDGSRIAFTHGLIGDRFAFSFGSTLYVMHSDGSHVRRLLGHSCNPGTPAWSPDGKQLAFTCDDGLYAMRLRDGKLRRIAVANYSKDSYSTAANSLTPSWSSDGRTIALSGGIWGIELFQVDKKAVPKSILTGSFSSVIVAAWSPDGRRLAYSISDNSDNSGNSGGLYVIEALKPEPTHVAPGLSGAPPQSAPTQAGPGPSGGSLQSVPTPDSQTRLLVSF
ncbi:MAG: hypothetical protein ABSC51_10090 [Gaiellaceae bacterium]|jgi:Tol biopolymer transport system component